MTASQQAPVCNLIKDLKLNQSFSQIPNLLKTMRSNKLCFKPQSLNMIFHTAKDNWYSRWEILEYLLDPQSTHALPVRISLCSSPFHLPDTAAGKWRTWWARKGSQPSTPNLPWLQADTCLSRTKLEERESLTEKEDWNVDYYRDRTFSFLIQDSSIPKIPYFGI